MTNTPMTLIGNLVEDPELRFTPSGAAVANFRIASTPRHFSREKNDWVDGETMFLSCSVWRQQAENVAESLRKGMRVILTGKLKSRTYETREGEKRTVFELDVDEVGGSLKYATADITRTTRDSGGRGESGSWSGGESRNRGGDADRGASRSTRSDSRRDDDPWNPSARPKDDADPWRTVGIGDQPDEPPF